MKREAERYGVAVLESEIVGLVPAAALTPAAEFYLQIEGFKADQVLENKLRRAELPNAGLDRFMFARPPARRRDAERLHLPIEVAALDAEHLGGPRHVALLLGQRPQDESRSN